MASGAKAHSFARHYGGAEAPPFRAREMESIGSGKRQWLVISEEWLETAEEPGWRANCESA